jgi:hypothetical protein
MRNRCRRPDKYHLYQVKTFVLASACQGQIQDFKLGGGTLKKFVGVFRVKNHDFMPKNHIFSNCGGRRENVWGISCEKSRFFAKKILFFPILGGGVRRMHPSPGSAPACSVRVGNEKQ